MHAILPGCEVREITTSVSSKSEMTANFVLSFPFADNSLNNLSKAALCMDIPARDSYIFLEAMPITCNAFLLSIICIRACFMASTSPEVTIRPFSLSTMYFAPTDSVRIRGLESIAPSSATNEHDSSREATTTTSIWESVLILFSAPSIIPR